MESVPEMQPPVKPTIQPPNNLLIIITGILIFIFGGIAGFYLAGHKELLSAFSFGPKPVGCTLEAKICPDGSSVGRTGPKCEFAACPTPTPDPTASWKTYTNHESNYQLKYPNDWSISNTVYPQIIPPKEGQNNEGRISILISTSQGDLDQFMAKQNPATGTLNSKVYLFDSNMKVGGETALVTHGGCCGFFGIHVFFQHSGKTYQIALSGPTENPQKLYRSVFDQILSSFKFLDQNDPTANWKTYLNKKYSFEFKYPDTYTDVSANGFPGDTRQNLNYFAIFKNLTNPSSISLMIDQTPFSLEALRVYAPTGSESIDPIQQKVGSNTFYYYGPGGGGVNYPDQFFYNLNGKILIFIFNGPYGNNDKSPSKETQVIEHQILSTFKLLPASPPDATSSEAPDIGTYQGIPVHE